MSDFVQFRNDLVLRAMRLAGFLPQGNQPTANQMADAVQTANVLVKSFGNIGFELWKSELLFSALVVPSECVRSGVNYRCIKTHVSYTDAAPGTGSLWREFWIESGTSTTAWASVTAYYSGSELSVPSDVVAVDQIMIRDSVGIDTPVQMVSRAEFLSIQDKTGTGLPIQAWFERATSPVIHLNPAPSLNTYLIRYNAISFPDGMMAPGSTPDFPASWMDAFTYALAAELADENEASLEKCNYLTQKANGKIEAARRGFTQINDGEFVNRG